MLHFAMAVYSKLSPRAAPKSVLCGDLMSTWPVQSLLELGDLSQHQEVAGLPVQTERRRLMQWWLLVSQGIMGIVVQHFLKALILCKKAPIITSEDDRR